MVIGSAVILLIISSAHQSQSVSGKVNKGNCPAPSALSEQVPKRATPSSPLPDLHYIGTVTMVVSLSDTGYVCDVKVLKTLNDKLDKQAVDVIRETLFQPIRENRKPIAGSMVVQRDFWRGNTSDTLYSENAGAVPDEISLDARSFAAPDVAFVKASGKASGTTYRNHYFGLSFVAPGAVIQIPAGVDQIDGPSVLVTADAGEQKRADRYSITIVAEPLSALPQLKSVSEYVNSASAQARREGAQSSHQELSYLISGIEFAGTTLEIPDGANLKHFQGIFGTTRKGYLLTISVTAVSEQKVLDLASAISLSRSE